MYVLCKYKKREKKKFFTFLGFSELKTLILLSESQRILFAGSWSKMKTLFTINKSKAFVLEETYHFTHCLITSKSVCFRDFFFENKFSLNKKKQFNFFFLTGKECFTFLLSLAVGT